MQPHEWKLKSAGDMTVICCDGAEVCRAGTRYWANRILACLRSLDGISDEAINLGYVGDIQHESGKYRRLRGALLDIVKEL